MYVTLKFNKQGARCQFSSYKRMMIDTGVFRRLRGILVLSTLVCNETSWAGHWQSHIETQRGHAVKR
jgi:hypothetical protein